MLILIAPPKDSRFDFSYNQEAGYRTYVTHSRPSIGVIWHECREIPMLMFGTGYFIGFFLSILRTRSRRGGTPRIFAAVAGGLVFGTLLFSAGLVSHCIFGGFKHTHRNFARDDFVMLTLPMPKDKPGFNNNFPYMESRDPDAVGEDDDE